MRRAAGTSPYLPGLLESGGGSGGAGAKGRSGEPRRHSISPAQSRGGIAQWASARPGALVRQPRLHPQSSAWSPRGPQLGRSCRRCLLPPSQSSSATASRGEGASCPTSPTAGKLRHQQQVALERQARTHKAPSTPHHPSHSPEDPARDPQGSQRSRDASRLAWGAAGGTPPSLCPPTSEDRGKPWLLLGLPSQPAAKAACGTSSREPSTLPIQAHPPGPGPWLAGNPLLQVLPDLHPWDSEHLPGPLAWPRQQPARVPQPHPACASSGL